MSINQSIYSSTAQVRELPIYLIGVGGSEYQYHIKRPEGYLWDQILYSAKGQGCLKYGNTTISISPGSFFFLPRNQAHEYYPVGGNWDVRWVVFDGYACPQILKELGLTAPIHVKPDDITTLDRIYNKIFVAQKVDKVYGEYTCSGLVYQYLLELYKNISDKGIARRSDKSDLLMPVLNYIDNYYAHDFPMTILAEKVGISSQHLCRVFKETMHMTPTEYLTFRRLTEAKKLLWHTDLTVVEIGKKVGFPDASYFTTVFKRYEDITPAEYRKRMRGTPLAQYKFPQKNHGT